MPEPQWMYYLVFVISWELKNHKNESKWQISDLWFGFQFCVLSSSFYETFVQISRHCIRYEARYIHGQSYRSAYIKHTHNIYEQQTNVYYNLNEMPSYRTLAHFGTLFILTTTYKYSFLSTSYLRRIEMSKWKIYI